MAQRRMFSKTITSSDKFLDLPISSRLLYFHLGMEADDEGFVGNAKTIRRTYGFDHDDLEVLIKKGFVISFTSGVVVICDWNINNQGRKGRFEKTIYQTEKSMLTKDEAGSYRIDFDLSRS